MMRKNDQASRIAARRKHRKHKRERRKEAPQLDRGAPVLEEKPTILIVCEGEKTEPSYFNQFRLSSATVMILGEGYNTKSLVQRALDISKEEHYDQVWCVFDADPQPDKPHHAENFNAAIQLCENHDLGIAYSNQAFEYWLILHFNDHQGGAMGRSLYDAKINQLVQPFGVNFDGKGRKIIEDDFFELLNGLDSRTQKSRVDLAITRAERNYLQWDHTNPVKEESSTTVFRLVRELLKYI